LFFKSDFFFNEINMKHSRISATQRGYGSRWQRYRERFLKANPLCAMHLSFGKTVASEVVDHIEPHKGSHRLFWNPKNHQALCKQCHDTHKQRLEKSGVVLGCDERGIPIDPNHHWSKPRGV
jgi:5-methylcytosine-specific restriction endonuclease McrA